MSGCTLDIGSTFNALTVDGGPIRSDATFNNVTDFNSTHLRGSAMFSGRERREPYGTVSCQFDYMIVQTGTTLSTMGTLCGKTLRTSTRDTDG